jgi:hypothetical protein
VVVDDLEHAVKLQRHDRRDQHLFGPVA